MRRLDDWIGSFLQYTEDSEPPILFRKWVAISTIAAVLQRRVSIRLGDNLHYPNLYTVLVSEPGIGRKGTAMRFGRTMLKELGVKFASNATSREALIEGLRASSANMILDGVPYTHASLNIFSSELSVFLGVNNKQLLDDLTDWFDSPDDWEYSTIGRGNRNMENVWVNILGATTPDQIKATLPKDLVGGGLASRILFIYSAGADKRVPFPILDEDLRKLLLDDLSIIQTLGGRFSFDKTFLDAYADWYTDPDFGAQFSRDRNFIGYTSRQQVHLLKLCMVVSASESNSMIVTGETFARALKLLTEAERQMRRVFLGYGSGDQSYLIGQTLQEIAEAGKIKQSQLYERLIFEIPDQYRFGGIIATLSMGGIINVDRTNAVDPTYSINPSNPTGKMFLP